MSHFNEKAKSWDDESKIKMMSILAKETLQVLKLDKKIDILDFGCGTGLFGLEMADYANRLVGIDTSEGMLNVFNLKTQGHSHIESMMIDLESNDLNQHFDLIVSSMAFHHLKDPKSMLIKFKSMLRPNGQIAVVDLLKEDGSFHPDPLKMGVQHYGFARDVVGSWAETVGMKLEYRIVHTISKNGREYPQFLMVLRH